MSEALLERALNRISVRPPYLGFDHLVPLGPGMVASTVPPAPPTLPERGVIEAGQVARHLAILGSCAAALGRDDDARHHYLATDAHFVRVAGSAVGEVDERLVGEALACWVDRRTARAMVKLGTESGLGLHVLDVRYAVLTPPMFRRLNPPVEAATCVESPPANRLVGGDVESLDGGVRVHCGRIPESACVGHFPDYPAAPVAVVMAELCRAAGIGLSNHLGREVSYVIEEGHVKAQKLAHAGQELQLDARYDREVDGGHLLHGVARADGEVVGGVSVKLAC